MSLDLAKILRRFKAGRSYYKYDTRRLRQRNNPESQAESAREYGGYSKYEIKIIPIKSIKVPEVWNPPRFEKALELMKKGQPLDPIDVNKEGSKWGIGDGIHRTNASIALGYTHIPAFFSTWVDTPDLYEQPPEEKPELPLGSWVRLNKPLDSKTYGWVDEKLSSRNLKGVKRHWYGLSLVDHSGDWDGADLGDHQFEPVEPPPWGPGVKARFDAARETRK